MLFIGTFYLQAIRDTLLLLLQLRRNCVGDCLDLFEAEYEKHIFSTAEERSDEIGEKEVFRMQPLAVPLRMRQSSGCLFNSNSQFSWSGYPPSPPF